VAHQAFAVAFDGYTMFASEAKPERPHVDPPPDAEEKGRQTEEDRSTVGGVTGYRLTCGIVNPAPQGCFPSHTHPYTAPERDRDGEPPWTARAPHSHA